MKSFLAAVAIGYTIVRIAQHRQMKDELRRVVAHANFITMQAAKNS